MRLFGIWLFTIDGGEVIEVTVHNLNDGAIALAAALSGYGLAIENGYDFSTEVSYLLFSNTSNENRRIELIKAGSDVEGQCLLNYIQNPAINIIEGSSIPNDDNRLNFSKAALCLSPLRCPRGYKRTMHIPTSVGVDPEITEIQNGDTVYIPIALTPDGDSITHPFVINADFTDIEPDFYWYVIGRAIAEQLEQQLSPHNLHADWNNNFREFGVVDSARRHTLEETTEFYILDEGNTFPAEQMPRGLVAAYCWVPT